MAEIIRRSLWHDLTRVPPIAAGETRREADVLVIGAGLTGLAAAVLLARAGRRPTVLEARSIGATTSGSTTGKISVLQGLRLTDVLKHHSNREANAYVRANQEAKDWVEQFAGGHDVALQIRDAVNYSTTEAGRHALQRDFRSMRELGLDPEHVERHELPFPATGAVKLPNQAQFDPMQMLRELAAELLHRDGQIAEGVRARSVEAGTPCTVGTSRGTFHAEHVVVATGMPFLDRGLYFGRLRPERSYVVAFDPPSAPPPAMYLSVDAPTRSVRSAPTPGGEKLLVGGSGHIVGRGAPEQAHVDALIAWTEQHFPGASPTHSWSAQDYVTPDRCTAPGLLPTGRCSTARPRHRCPFCVTPEEVRCPAPKSRHGFKPSEVPAP